MKRKERRKKKRKKKEKGTQENIIPQENRLEGISSCFPRAPATGNPRVNQYLCQISSCHLPEHPPSHEE